MNINPVRGCGQLVPGGFYLRGLYSPFGTLSPVTWVLGNGIVGEQPLIKIAPREARQFNPAASLLFGEVVDSGSVIPDEFRDPYSDMCKRTDYLGIADHVGKKFYSAHSFVSELREYGVSRHVAPHFAFLVNRALAVRGAVPIFFTHPLIPVFRTTDERDAAFGLACEYFSNDSTRDDRFWNLETWKHKDWGMRVKYPWKGWGHMYVLILALVDAAYKAKKESRYYPARKIVRGWEYQESWLVATWCNQVAYVMPEDRVVPKEVAAAKMAIIDLEEE